MSQERPDGLSHRLPGVVKSHVDDARSSLRDVIRMCLLGAVALAADRLPSNEALAAATLAGRLDASRMLNVMFRREMKRAFGLDNKAAAAAARLRATCRYSDFVVNRRIRSAREAPSTWRVVERNPEVVNGLRQSGASFVIATGHFARHPSYALWTGMTIPHRVVGVTVSPDDRRQPSLRDRWRSAHLGLMLEIWTRAGVDFVTVGDELSAANIVRRLKRPGTAVIISTDAPIRPENRRIHRRAFAGHAMRHFSLGTASVARLAGCPVVVCSPYLEDGAVVLDWVGPIVADANEPDADVDTTDKILNELERMIAHHPTQYVLPIGDERRWNADAQRWEPI